MSEGTEEKFEGWAVLELMGHRRLAGYVREQSIAGAGFLRLDVPGGATQFYSPSSVYCVTPTTEELAKRIAAQVKPAPVHPFELPAHRPEPQEKNNDDGDDEPNNVGGEDC